MSTIYAYVPAPDAVHAIDPKSGIVGTPTGDGRILVYYEGNRHGYSNVHTFADRCAIAAGRLQERYPTIARASLPLGDLRRVGSWTPFGILLFDGIGLMALSRWLELGEWIEVGCFERSTPEREWVPDSDALAAELLPTGVAR